MKNHGTGWRQRPIRLLSVVVMLLMAVPAGAEEKSVAKAVPPKTLRISLFSYVPSPGGIEGVLQRHWTKRHPGIKLKFDSPAARWNCYADDPSAELDVFEFDALFLEYFVRNNLVSPVTPDDLTDVEDFADFSLRGCMVDGVLYGVPRIACSPVLFYRRGDAEIEKAVSIEDLFKVIGPQPGQEACPPMGKGLLIDLSGGTTCACFYLDARADLTGRYSIHPDLPNENGLDRKAIDNVKLLTRMAGRAQAVFEDNDGQRTSWFGQGNGRAWVGFTERLSAIPVEAHAKIGVRALPLAAKNGVNLLFLDMLGINPTLHGERRRLALELANLAASRKVVVECFLVRNPQTQSPQYLLPVRRSALSDPELLKQAPLYRELSVLITENPHAFRIGDQSRAWLAATKKSIQAQVTQVE